MTTRAEPGWVPPPGSNGYPVADARCRSCLHPKRQLLESLLDAGVKPPTVARMLQDLGFWSPGPDSLRNHHRRHRQADPQAMRRAQGQLRLAELDRRAHRARTAARNLADTLRMAAAIPPDVPQEAASSPADARQVPAARAEVPLRFLGTRPGRELEFLS